MPSRTVAPRWLVDTPFAHRGLHDAAGGVPENSLAAFSEAIDAGYAIELDVQRAGDGNPVVFHDDSLERLTELRGAVAERSVAELSSARLLNTSEQIPTLAEALAHIGARTPVLVELKNWRVADGALEMAVWKVLQDYTGPFAVQSFNPYCMAWFARHAPAAIRGQISTKYTRDEPGGSMWHKWLMQNLLLNHLSRPHFIAYNIHHLKGVAPRLARRFGLPLLTWAVRNEDQWRLAKRYADNIIFETIRP